MITLTAPISVHNVFGGSNTVDYDKLVIARPNLDPVDMKITGQARLYSTANTEMPVLTGQLTVDSFGLTASLQIEDGEVQRKVKVTLTQAHKTAIQTAITDAHAAVENGIVSIGLVDGTRSAGV